MALDLFTGSVGKSAMGLKAGCGGAGAGSDRVLAFSLGLDTVIHCGGAVGTDVDDKAGNASALRWTFFGW